MTPWQERLTEAGLDLRVAGDPGVEAAAATVELARGNLPSKDEAVTAAFRAALYKWLKGSPLAEGRIPNKDEAFYYGLFKKWPEPGWLPTWLKWSLILSAVIGIVSTGYFVARKIAS